MGLHAHNRDPNLLRYIKVVPFFRTARYMIYLNNIKPSSGIGKVAHPDMKLGSLYLTKENIPGRYEKYLLLSSESFHLLHMKSAFQMSTCNPPQD